MSVPACHFRPVRFPHLQHLLVIGGEEVDALGDEQGHLVGARVSDGLQEDAVSLGVCLVSPAVRPAQDDRVGSQSAHSGRLHTEKHGTER